MVSMVANLADAANAANEANAAMKLILFIGDSRCDRAGEICGWLAGALRGPLECDGDGLALRGWS